MTMPSPMRVVMRSDFEVGDLVKLRLLPVSRPNEGVIVSINEEGIGFAEPMPIYYVLLHGTNERVPCIAGELEKV